MVGGTIKCKRMLPYLLFRKAPNPPRKKTKTVKALTWLWKFMSPSVFRFLGSRYADAITFLKTHPTGGRINNYVRAALVIDSYGNVKATFLLLNKASCMYPTLFLSRIYHADSSAFLNTVALVSTVVSAVASTVVFTVFLRLFLRLFLGLFLRLFLRLLLQLFLRLVRQPRR